MPSAPDVREACVAHRRAVLALVAALAQAVQVTRVYAQPGRPPLLDSIIVEYVGWRVARGATLYVDIWEVKPPLAFETTAAVATLTGDRMALFHALNVALTSAVVVGCVLLVGELVYRVTDDAVAAVAGGLSFYLLPGVALRAAVGFKPKYFVVFAGLLAVLLAREDRPAAAGAAAAASVGYWQLAAGFPLVVAGMAARRGGRRGVARVCAGGAVASVLILAPVLAAGPRGVEAMAVETVLAPLTTTDGGVPLDYAATVPLWFDWGSPLAVAGAGGALGLGLGRWREEAWWAVAGVGWFALVLATVDLDTYPDVIPLAAFVAVGVGLVVAALDDGAVVASLDAAVPAVGVESDVARRARTAARTAVCVGVCAVLVVNVGFMSGFGLVEEPTTTPTAGATVHPAAINPPYGDAERRTLFWRGIESESCRFTTGAKQRGWVRRVNRSLVSETCGYLPDGQWLSRAGTRPLLGDGRR